MKIVNRLTLESALFNPLRARRPTQPGAGDSALEAWIARELAELEADVPRLYVVTRQAEVLAPDAQVNLEQIGRTLADHVVVNDDLERAVGEVAGILGKYRNQPLQH